MREVRREKPTFRHKSRRILIISGTPGVGKSSVAGLLASRIGAKLISLGKLVDKEKLQVGLDKKRNTLVVETERVRARVEKLTEGSVGDVVVEGHFAVYAVSPTDVGLVFVLRRDPQELRGVLTERSYSEEKVKENLAAEILDVCLYDAVSKCGVNKVCEVEVTDRKFEDVVEEIVQVLDGRKECRVGLVDWLGRLESEGKLDKYLKEI